MKKKFVVYGLGLSGKAAVQFLLDKKENVIISNDRESDVDALKEVYKDNSLLESKHWTEYNWKEIDCIVLAAGIAYSHPQPHDVVIEAHKHNCPVVSDIEILTRFCPNGNYIGITGTNGKSTTTSLIGHIFESEKLNSDFGGNLGNKAALSLKTDNENGTYIVELSSYTLETTVQNKINYSILTNITPDHIERHGDLDGYKEAKKRIFLNHNEKCYAIINIDDKGCQKVYEELRNDSSYKGHLVPLSIVNKLSNGFSAIDGKFYKDGEEIISYNSFDNLKGEHNLQNILCAFAVCYLNNINRENIIKHTRSFKPLKHRMQLIGEKNGIKFINDSKSTNAESTAPALKTYDNIYWIVGGKAKEEGIEPLIKCFSKIKKAFLIGEATDRFTKILEENNVDFEACETLDNAVKSAYENAKREAGNIVLSPACASFDQFKNFEERGDKFIEIFEVLE